MPDGHEQYSESPQERAEALWRKAYEVQLKGDLEEAVELYTQSIECCPTAEAYTFRGWAKSYLGKLDEAIEDCQRAIEVDPDFGNPYNDIGAYLIEKGDDAGAITWLEKALRSRRYECYFYPHYNLGRIYERQGKLIKAMNCYKAAYDENKGYHQALKAWRRLQARVN